MTALDRFVVHLFRICLHAYPRAFRREFEVEMVQVFETTLRAGHVPRVILLLGGVADLGVAGVRERIAAVRLDARALLVALAAVLLSTATGYVHLRTDADGTAALLVLAAGLLCGLAYPGKPLRWGLIVGMGVPLMLLAGRYLASIPRSPHDPDTLSLLILVPALFGAYAGSALGSQVWRPVLARIRT